jgi:hypothetical protein
MTHNATIIAGVISHTRGRLLDAGRTMVNEGAVFVGFEADDICAILDRITDGFDSKFDEISGEFEPAESLNMPIHQVNTNVDVASKVFHNNRIKTTVVISKTADGVTVAPINDNDCSHGAWVDAFVKEAK